VTEEEYFGHLEYRISRELRGMSDPALRGFWCDGFVPEKKFVVTKAGCHIAGRVWMDNGKGNQFCWNFVVLLSRERLKRDDVKWAEQMPPENHTGWLSLDFHNEFMKVKPFAAYADRAPVVLKSLVHFFFGYIHIDVELGPDG
jgi:hypothetical protein